jgi:4-oxalocrotonate tautomerase
VPLVRVDLATGTSPEYRKGIGEVIYDAMLAVLNVPKDDRFQIITEHAPENFVMDPTFQGITRSKQSMTIQITLNDGRSVEMKKAFYKAVADGLHERLNVRREDVFINLVEVKKENWSFGNGEAQFAPAT